MKEFAITVIVRTYKDWQNTRTMRDWMEKITKDNPDINREPVIMIKEVKPDSITKARI